MIAQIESQSQLFYDPKSLQILGPLHLKNNSQFPYAFKIKTNQLKLLSVPITNGFLKPLEQVNIPIRLVEQPGQKNPIVIKILYCIPTQEMMSCKDSKMSNIPKKDISEKKINIIAKKVQPNFSVDKLSSSLEKQKDYYENKDKSLPLQILEQKQQEDEEEHQSAIKRIENQIDHQKNEHQSLLKQIETIKNGQQIIKASTLFASMVTVFLLAQLFKYLYYKIN